VWFFCVFSFVFFFSYLPIFLASKHLCTASVLELVSEILFGCIEFFFSPLLEGMEPSLSIFSSIISPSYIRLSLSYILYMIYYYYLYNSLLFLYGIHVDFWVLALGTPFFFRFLIFFLPNFPTQLQLYHPSLRHDFIFFSTSQWHREPLLFFFLLLSVRLRQQDTTSFPDCLPSCDSWSRNLLFFLFCAMFLFFLP